MTQKKYGKSKDNKIKKEVKRKNKREMKTRKKAKQ